MSDGVIPSGGTPASVPSSSASAQEASRLMPPPPRSAERRSGPGRPPRSGRGPGRPPKNRNRGGRIGRGPGRPPLNVGRGSSEGRSQIRRGPGRPPGPSKRKKQEDGKARRKYTKRKSNASTASSVDLSDRSWDDEDDIVYYNAPSSRQPSGYETDPETALDVDQGKVSTVHWDPTEGSKIGWKARLLSGPEIQDGRIERYDPYSHKHKIIFDNDDDDFEETKMKKRKHKQLGNEWVRLHHTDLQMATRLVWAHVKGYAWWPAMVMELSSVNSSVASPREGYVHVHFIGSPEVATLRDSPECVRPFSSLIKDPIIEKSKKKRNAKAIANARWEEIKLQQVKNAAARHFAKKAFCMVDQTLQIVGKRVKLFSNDINYPDGATVIGFVRQYSSVQKKWLVSFEISHKLKYQRSAMWINLQAKDCSLTVLQDDNNTKASQAKKLKEPNDLDLIPYLFGFSYELSEKLPKTPKKKKTGEVVDDEENEGSSDEETEPKLGSDRFLANALKERCRACVDVWSGENTITCHDCKGSYHLGCVDPPVTKEMYQKIPKDEHHQPINWTCPKCTLCLGCYHKDITFGCHSLHPVPPTVSLPPGEPLPLCSMCIKAYENEKFCPNCAHSWDDIKYQKVLEQMDEEEEAMLPPEKASKKERGADSIPEMTGNMIATAKGMPPNTPFSDGKLLNGARVDPAWYYAENNVWGYTEGDMLVCDSCDLWVHAGCAGLSQEEYDMTSEGEHPIYSQEFLCRVCCRRRCVKLIETLQKYDNMMLFAVPVTEKVAPNYRDVIKNPMDLQTMREKAKKDEYLNYAWVRDAFSLMVLNALTFNRFYTKFWNEAKRYYEECVEKVFAPNQIGRAAPLGKYDEAVLNNFAAAESARQMEVDRVQQDASAEKKDLVAGAEVAKVTLAPLRENPPDESSCLPYQEVKVKPVDAYYYSWMDCCFTCGSSGASDTMVFCVDCGESFHSFCANVPIHSMDLYSVAGWRCPNCKVCEISGDVPADELRMLFCEMCDRAFSLDLLDPPLKGAPSGLWICGQCVDCKVCKNTSEPPRPGAKSDPGTSAISLKYWSRDPEKCYRCGGCDGISDQILGEKLGCQLCKKILREDDGNFIKCSSCRAPVHTACDNRADEFMKFQRTEELFGSRTLKAQKTKPQYDCPKCAGVAMQTELDYDTVDTSRKAQVHDQAWQTIVQGDLQCDNFTPLDLHGKLLHQLDWQTREMWRDEYVNVVKEGIEFYEKAKSSFGDPRTMVQDIANGKLDLPMWMGQRAYRFIVLAKRWKWDTEGFSSKGIEGCVFAAKLAAAFLTVACRAMHVDLKQGLKTYARVESLLKAPQAHGVFEIPMDQVRCEEQEGISESHVVERFSSLANDKENGREITQCPAGVSEVIMASPLAGWGRHVDPSSMENAWRDPRECCLCHICGDDDAGFPEPEDSDVVIAETVSTNSDGTTATATVQTEQATELDVSWRFPRLGRLLPMSEGQWVHASCALWSSEVWESPRGGLINAMEKARSRGAQLKCFGCGRPGATVGCNKPNCSFNYHFPCAKACGAVFTSKQQVFCFNHKSSHQAGGHIVRESFESMKTLIVAPEKQKPLISGNEKEGSEPKELCLRVGSLIVHSLGSIVQDIDGFHTEDYIYPQGYIATRIFWSTVSPRTRTVYILKVERNSGSDNIEGPLFTITPGDAPASKIRGRLVSLVYKTLLDRVRKVNADYFSQGDLFSKLPMARKTRKKFFALNGPQFFGFGVDLIREKLEKAPGIEAVAAPPKPTSPKYRFCFVQPSVDSIVDLQRKRAAVAAERALENSSGCARTEGRVAVDRSGGSGRITRALVRSVEDEGAEEAGPISSTVGRRKNTDSEKNKIDKKRHQAKYTQMKSVPMEDRLVARRSHIHGWGLFTKVDMKKDDMITEYMGEIVRQCVADKRERQYEISGEGSCYMFRLDLSRIVDATVIGCMARFMNHCCQPNAYAKIITVDTEFGVDKKIAVLAHRDIAAGEEITYDYKFPVEDGSLRCTCGAPNCIGRMN